MEDTLPLNYDETFEVEGHMPFGATSHPKTKHPGIIIQEYLFVILAVVAIIILIIIAVYLNRKN
jgi:hypothetical protein